MQSRTAIAASVKSGPVMSDLVLTQVNVDGRGDLAYVRGNYSLKVLLPGAKTPIPDKGKYIEIWHKGTDGSWKTSKVIYNSDNPVAAPPPAKPAKASAVNHKKKHTTRRTKK